MMLINFILDIDHGFVIKITNITEFTKEFDWYIPKINIATGQEIEIYNKAQGGIVPKLKNLITQIDDVMKQLKENKLIILLVLRLPPPPPPKLLLLPLLA